MEWEVLGECMVRTSVKMDFWQAVAFAKRHQPHDPFHPRGAGADFQRAVADELPVCPSRLGLYTGLGTPLDRLGVDGFFFWDGLIVSFDLTKNPHKDSTRARVLVTGEDVVCGFPWAAYQIAECFRSLIKTRAQRRRWPCEGCEGGVRWWRPEPLERPA